MEEQKKQDVASHSLESEFVTYEQALALKELGFNEYCVGFFYKPNLIWYEEINQSNLIDGEVVAPLKQQVLRWFRDKYGLDGFVFNSGDNKYSFNISDNYFLNTTYEEAENACIDKLISICKQQDK